MLSFLMFLRQVVTIRSLAQRRMLAYRWNPNPRCRPASAKQLDCQVLFGRFGNLKKQIFQKLTARNSSFQ